MENGTTIKTNRWIFFGLNGLLLLPVLIRNASLLGLAAAGAVLLVALGAVVLTGGDRVPASASLGTLVFLDGCALAGLFFERLREQFSPAHLEEVLLRCVMTPSSLVLACVGLALGILGFLLPKLSWLIGVGGAGIGSAVILPMWSNCDWKNLQFNAGGRALFTVFLAGVLGWTVLSQFLLYIVPKKRIQNQFLGLLLLLGTIAFLMTEPNMAQDVAIALSKKLPELPQGLLAWWKVVLACGVLLGCAVSMHSGQCGENQLGADSFVMASCASFLLAIRVLLSSQFPFRWPLLLVLIASTFLCLRNEAANRKTLRLHAGAYLAVQTAVFLGLVKAFEMGLWMNVLIAFLFALLFYSQYGRLRSGKYQNVLWGAVIACLVCEALAWQWKMRFSTEGILLLAMICLLAVLTFLVLNLPHPDQHSASNTLRYSICGCVAVLCLLSMRTTIAVTAEQQDAAAVLSIEAKGEDNRIAEAVYYWRDAFGREVGSQQPIPHSSLTLPIEGELLTVIATDASGVRTIRNFWYSR